MLKILKNLKLSWISVVIIVLFLGLQAAADLKLPDYTSKIVNVGIQQGGIENSSPEVVRKKTMDNILLFTQDDNEILENYTLLSKNNLDSKEYDKYVKKYPALENEEIYILKNIKREQEENLSSKMAKPLMILENLKNEEIDKQVRKAIFNQMPETLKAQYQDANALELIKVMVNMQVTKSSSTAKTEENSVNKMLGEQTSKIEQMPESLIEQSAIQAIKNEYREIGINTDDYQNRYIVYSGLQMLLVAFISMATGITIMLLSSRVAARLGKTVREKIFKKVLSFSTSEFKEFKT